MRAARMAGMLTAIVATSSIAGRPRKTQRCGGCSELRPPVERGVRGRQWEADAIEESRRDLVGCHQDGAAHLARLQVIDGHLPHVDDVLSLKKI